MASARQKNGKWYYRITVTVGDGSHKYIERGSFRTKKEALQAGNKVELQIKEGDSIPEKQKIVTFDFLQKEWLENSTSFYKPKTIFTYRDVLSNHITPMLKDYSITAIKTATCQKVIDKAVEEKHALNKIRQIRSCMRQCFKYGIRMGYMKENPAINVYIPERRSIDGQKLKKEREVRSLPPEEIKAIFEYFPEGSPYYIPLILGYRCGLRIGEVFAVFIEDIDFKNKVIHVRRQIQADEDGKFYFTAPKYCNPGEGRDVDLDDDTLNILKRHVDKIIACSSALGYPVYREDETHHLSTDTGNIIDPICLRLSNGEYLRRDCIIYVGKIIHGKHGHFPMVDKDWDFHALRHTHASECIAAGMDPVSVQKRLGHRSLATTYKYYVHETQTQVTKSRDIINKMYQ